MGVNSALSACGTKQHWTRVSDLLATMSTLASTQQSKSYNSSITATHRSSYWCLAAHLLDEMHQARVVPEDTISQNAVISSCEQGRYWSRPGASERSAPRPETHLAFQHLKYPDKFSLSASIGSCIGASFWTGAMALLQAHLQLSNEVSYGATISACEKGYEWSWALELVSCMGAAALLPNTTCCNSAISACEKGFRWLNALAVLQVMASLQVKRSLAECVEWVVSANACMLPLDEWKEDAIGSDADFQDLFYADFNRATGEEFDSSKDKAREPAVFDLGKGEVIKGWEAGIPTMRVGEEARLTIAPELAYGVDGLPPKIPSNATLVFDVDLLSFDCKDNLFGDWACMRTVIREGDGWGCLMDDCEVEISIRAEAEDGRTLEERRQVPYNLGSGKLGDLSLVADRALREMKKGGLVELRCAPKYAYGNDSHGEVTIRIEVHEVYMDEDVTPNKTGEVKKKQLREGAKNESPRDTAQCILIVEVVKDSKGVLIACFDGPTEITFRAGDGYVCDALELAVKHMNEGERAIVTCSTPSMCADPALKLSVQEGEEAIFTVELKSFRQARGTFEMPEGDKMAYGAERKETGSRLFREGRYFLALQRYRGVLEFLSYCENLSEAGKLQMKELKKTCELNQAQCRLKLGDFYGAKVACDAVLAEEPTNLKALFRRASANLKRRDFADALSDLKLLLELDPKNSDARRLLPEAQKGAKEGEKKARSMYAKMTKSLGTGKEDVKGIQFSFDPEPESFSALFLDSPARNTSSCNAGDYRLYVGGGAINRAFGDLLKREQGLQFGRTSEDYRQLHMELLHASRKAGRKLVSARDLPKAAALLPKLSLLAAFGRAADEVELEDEKGAVPELRGAI
ncbi:FKBP62, partial [Symbiodinium pilosum]